MNARVIFTKETKRKMEQGLSKREIGKLRFERLKAAEADGKLSRAKNRSDVLKIAGFTESQRGLGYSWVGNLVRRGHMQEIITGYGRKGRAEYEYHLISEPQFVGFKRGKKATTSVEAPKPTVATQVIKIDTTPTRPVAVANNSPTTTKVTIRYNDLVIELEQVDCNFVAKMIASLTNKQ